MTASRTSSTLRGLAPRGEELRRGLMASLRGTLVGLPLGVLPGFVPLALKHLGLTEEHSRYWLIRAPYFVAAGIAEALVATAGGLAVAVPAVFLFLRWRREGKWSRRGELPRGYVPPWVTAFGLALLVAGYYALSGMVANLALVFNLFLLLGVMAAPAISIGNETGEP